MNIAHFTLILYILTPQGEHLYKDEATEKVPEFQVLAMCRKREKEVRRDWVVIRGEGCRNNWGWTLSDPDNPEPTPAPKPSDAFIDGFKEEMRKPEPQEPEGQDV